MYVFNKSLLAAFAMTLLLFLSGCISVPEPVRLVPSVPADQSGKIAEEAISSLSKATDADKVREAILVMESALETNTDDLDILTRLSNLYIYKGSVLETRVSRKRAAYVKSMHYAEAAMMTSEKFRGRIERGDTVWDAAEDLDAMYVPCMSFWTTALFYQFDECMIKPLKPFNLRWVRRAEQVLSYAYDLDPDWGGGQLHFTYGIYYIMPAVAGGDMEKAEDYFSKAIEIGPNWLLNRWGRARYYYGKTGEVDAAKVDLEWVVAQDAEKAPGPIFWNLYCQDYARRMLQQMK